MMRFLTIAALALAFAAPAVAGTYTPLVNKSGVVQPLAAADSAKVPNLGASLPVCTDASKTLQTTGCTTVTTSGSITTNDCAAWSSSTAIKDAGGPCYVLIASGNWSGSSQSLALSGWTATGTNLRLVCSVQSAYAGGITDSINLAFNSDTTAADYTSAAYIGYLGGTASGTVASTTAGMFLANVSDQQGGANSNYSTFIVDIANFANTSFYKIASAVSSLPNVPQQFTNSAAWKSTAAITSLTLKTGNSNPTSSSKCGLYSY